MNAIIDIINNFDWEYDHRHIDWSLMVKSEDYETIRNIDIQSVIDTIDFESLIKSTNAQSIIYGGDIPQLVDISALSLESDIIDWFLISGVRVRVTLKIRSIMDRVRTKLVEMINERSRYAFKQTGQFPDDITSAICNFV